MAARLKSLALSIVGDDFPFSKYAKDRVTPRWSEAEFEDESLATLNAISFALHVEWFPLPELRLAHGRGCFGLNT